MGIAISLQQYLDGRGVPYEVMTHPRTTSSLATAHASLPAGFRLCLNLVSSAPDGCTSIGPECTAGVQQLVHLHRTIAVQGFAGTFADPNPTGCGHGVVVENERGCLPDTVPACQ